MSREAREWAWKSPVDDPTRLLILLSLADVADEYGRNAFPSVERLARDCRSSGRTVQRHLKAMVAANLLSVSEPARQHRPTTYAIVGLVTGDRLTGDNLSYLDTKGVTQGCHRGDTGVTNDEPTPLIGTGSGTGTDSLAFGRFWKVYPCHLDRKVAEASWLRALKRPGVEAEHLIAAAIAYRDDPNREDAFTKRAATWLNGECWSNPPLPVRQVNGHSSSHRNTNISTDRSAPEGRIKL